MSTHKKIAEQAAQRIAERANKRQIEAGKRLTAALEGDMKSRLWIQEGIATSDIPELLAPSINVRFLNQYAAVPRVWDQLATEFLMADLGKAEWGDFVADASALGGLHDGEEFVNGGLPKVGEYAEYPAVKFATQSLEAELHKHGVRARLSWEAIMKSGRIDLIQRFIDAFSQWAANTEDIKLARQFAAPGGTVNSDNWTVGNQVSGNPALTLSGLEAALGQSKQARVNGNPVTAPRYALVTTPALSQTAKNLLSITTVQRTDANGTYDVQANTITGNVYHVELSWIAAAELGASNLDAHWWIVPVGGARPAFLELFLEGYRTPLVSIKDSGHFVVGGGGVPARDGSFEVDDVQTRVRHLVETAPLELAGAVWSDGTES